MRTRIESLQIGPVAPLGPKGKPSGIAKTSVKERLHLARDGLVGDAQADLKNHGGPEKALHHYPCDHYAHWQKILRHRPDVLNAPGAFGENVSTFGWTEGDVCVGDVFELGSAVVQVSQARQPCWKLNARFGFKSMAMAVQSTRFSGWYYRVLSIGEIAAGDEMVLVDRPEEAWNLTRLMDIIYDKSHDQHDLRAMADLELLAPNWRKLAKRRLDTRMTEDWKSRLGD